MINVKIIKKPKQTGSAGAGTAMTGGGYSMSDAGRTAHADQADYADRAGYAARAVYADAAELLTKDSEVYEQFLRKDQADTARELITLLKGIAFQGGYGIDGEGVATLASVLSDLISSKEFVSGMGGKGFGAYLDTLKKSHFESDYLLARIKATIAEAAIDILTSKDITCEKLTVTKQAHFFKLIIDEIKAAGGQVVLSYADCTAERVVKQTNGNYRVYWACQAEKTGKAILNKWKKNDQALCQTFNAAEGVSYNVSNKYYWRLVVLAGRQTLDGTEYNYIELSDTVKDGDSVPEANDEIAGLGYRGTDDEARQSAIILSAYASPDRNVKAPAIVQYRGINSFSFDGCVMNQFAANGNIIRGQLRVESGKTVETAINDGVESIVVGGRNLMFNSSQFRINGGMSLGSDYISGQQYTISIVKSTLISAGSNPGVKMLLYCPGVSPSPLREFISISSKRQVLTFTYPQEGLGSLSLCATESWTGVSDITKLKIEIGNKATDWTPAPEDVQTEVDSAKLDAANAQTAATNAQTSANTANSLLADIANDNKLTTNEKQETKKDWDSIVSEYQKNITQAGKFSVATTAYTTAYNALSSYITPLLSNLGTTTDINGATFRATFKAYYDARTDLLNAISAKAKELADAAQTAANNAQKEAEKVRTEYKADFVILSDRIESKVSQTDFNALGQRVSNAESTITQLPNQITLAVTESKNYADGKVNSIQIGGRNLMLNSSQFRIIGGKSVGTNFIPGQQYTISIEKSVNIDSGSQRAKTLLLYCRDITPYPLRVNIPISESKQVATFTYPMTGKGNLVLCATEAWAGTSDITKLKIEQGNKATDWTPAPEDVQTEVDSAKLDAANAQTAATNAQTAANNAQKEAEKVRTEYKADFGVLNDRIESKVSQSDFNALGQRVSTTESTITQLPNQITLAVQESKNYADNAVNSIQVGGRNLMLNSSQFRINGGMSLGSDYISGQQYTISIVKSTLISAGSNPGVKMLLYCPGVSPSPLREFISISSKRQVLTFTYPQEGLGSLSLCATESWAGVSEITKLKIEIGNKATDWTPAPEDVEAGAAAKADAAINAAASDATAKANAAKQAAINDAAAKYTTKTEHSTQLAVLNSSISSKVSQTDFNALSTRMSTAEQKITPDSIKLTVKEQTEQIVDSSVSKINGVNLLLNTALTVDKTGWSDGLNGLKNMQRDPDMTYEGRCSLYISVYGNTKPFYASVQHSNSYLVAKEGDTFTASVYARKSNTSDIDKNVLLRIMFYKANGSYSKYFDKSITPQKNDTWERFTLTATAPAETVRVAYRLTIVQNGGFWVNGMMLVRGAKTTGWSQCPVDSPTTEQIKSSFVLDGNGISLFGKTLSLNGVVTFNSLAADAQEKINAAQSAASNAQTAANTAQSNANAAKQAANTALTQKIGLARLDATIIDGGYIKTNLIHAEELVVSHLSAADGTFRNLRCINQQGDTVASLAFSGYGDGCIAVENGDLFMQGYKGDRPLRFYSSDLWCRGVFGSRSRTLVEVNGTTAYYYSKGLSGAKVSLPLPQKTYNGETYYVVLCYGSPDLPLYDANGMPIDTVVFTSKVSIKYDIDLFETQRVLLFNANDNYSIEIYTNGKKRVLAGGEAIFAQNLRRFLYPSPNGNQPGAGIVFCSAYDNDYRQ